LEYRKKKREGRCGLIQGSLAQGVQGLGTKKLLASQKEVPRVKPQTALEKVGGTLRGDRQQAKRPREAPLGLLVQGHGMRRLGRAMGNIQLPSQALHCPPISLLPLTNAEGPWHSYL
jgi:hypothetical protein